MRKSQMQPCDGKEDLEKMQNQKRTKKETVAHRAIVERRETPQVVIGIGKGNI
jgi:hypothetical protein